MCIDETSGERKLYGRSQQPIPERFESDPELFALLQARATGERAFPAALAAKETCEECNT